MAEETFRPRRNEPNAEKLESMEAFRQNVSNQEQAPSTGFKISGNVPPELRQMLEAKGIGMPNAQSAPTPHFRNEDPGMSVQDNGGDLKELLEGARGSSIIYSPVQLPSLGKFYDGVTAPGDGFLSIRPMTGDEELILATTQYVRKGQAIDMIFQKCFRDGKFRPQNLLTVDRTYLLVYLRMISYGTEYNVEIRCEDCQKKFNHAIDLDTLSVDSCPDDFGPELSDTLPTTGYKFTYRLSTGKDEQEIQNHRERRVRNGASQTDDTLIYRTALLVNEIQGLGKSIKSKQDIEVLIKHLPISDVSYLRSCVNDVPFGLETNVDIMCPMCMHEFNVELPLEANFFFPRRKKGKTQA